MRPEAAVEAEVRMAIEVVRRDGAATALDAADLDGLQSALRGSLHCGPGSGSTHRLWNALIPDRPSLVVRCAGTADVAAAVGFASGGVAGPGEVGAGLVEAWSALRAAMDAALRPHDLTPFQCGALSVLADRRV